MDNPLSFFRKCLLYIKDNFQIIVTYYTNRNIDIKTIFGPLPPTVNEALLKYLSFIAPSTPHLSWFFRLGIKKLELHTYQFNFAIEEIAEIGQGITYLDLIFANTTEDNLKDLFQHLPNLIVLYLNETKTTDSVLESIGESCHLLECLDVSVCNISDAGLRSLCHNRNCSEDIRCKYLKTLNIQGTQVTPDGIAYLLEYIPLWEIRMNRINHLTTMHRCLMRNYGWRFNLRDLTLFPIEEKIDAHEMLLSVPRVDSLCIYKVFLTDLDLLSLPPFEYLRRLSISIHKSDDKLTFEKGIAEFLSISGKNLQVLKLNNFQYVNIHLIGLHCKNLRILKLYSIRHLYFRKNINLYDPNRSLFERLERIVIKNLRGNPWDRCLSTLFMNCNKLIHLLFISMSCVTDELFKEIVPFLATLKSLNIHYCNNVSKRTLYYIVDNIPKLKSLWVLSRVKMMSQMDEYFFKEYLKRKNVLVHFVYWSHEEELDIPSDEESVQLEEMQFY